MTGTITPGGPPVTVTIPSGDTARLTFSGTTNQRIFVQFTNNTISRNCLDTVDAWILKPDGTNLTTERDLCQIASFDFIETVTLPVSGTYTLVIDPEGTLSGSITATMYDVPPDPSPSLTPSQSGGAYTFTTATPGQNARATFSGAANQRIFVQFTNNTISTDCWNTADAWILKPDGTNLTSQRDLCQIASFDFIETVTLPVSGTYTLVINPEGALTGSVTATVYDVPPDPTASLELTTDGDSFAFATATPGQNAAATFDGLPGQDVLVRFTNIAFPGGCFQSVDARILRPDGSTLVSRSGLCTTLVETLGPVALPDDGLYTLVIDPYGARTGSITAWLYLDEPEVTPSGPFFEDIVYINGASQYPLTVSAHFPKGVSRAWLEKTGVGEVATSSTCDPATTTCPTDVDLTTNVDTAALSEGMHDYVAKALGPNGRASEEESWRIFIDRTPPASVSNIRVDSFNSADSSAAIAWDEAADPDLPGDVDASGAAGYDYRYQLNGQTWSPWLTSDAPSFEVGFAAPGTTVNVEVRERDGAGNVGPTASAVVTVTGTEAGPTATEVAEPAFTGAVGPLDPDVPDGDTQTLSFTPGPSTVTFVDDPAQPTWRFTNSDGTWDILRDCIDQNMSGGRFTVGPGYIAHLRTPGSNGRVLVRDDRIRRSDKEFIDPADSPVPFGGLGALNGGLGAFAFHYARSTNSAGQIPAGTDATRELSAAELEVISGGPRDARRVPVIEGRQCAGKNGNPNYGVYAVAHPPRLTGSGAPNNPRTDTQGNVRFTVSVWFRDEWGNTGYGPNAAGDADTRGDAITRVTYRYIFYPNVVKAWMAVTTYGSEDIASGTRYIKEPKFSAVVRGGGFTRVKVFGGEKGGKPLPHTRKFPSQATDGPVQGPRTVLAPRQVGYFDRTRVQWDYGDNACADSNCFNVVMRAYPVISRSTGGLELGLKAPLWHQTEDGVTRGFGLDWWARLSGQRWQGRSQAYPRDTRGDGVVWACRFVRRANELSEAERAQRGEALTTNWDERRRWEIGGWKQTTTSARFVASGTLFSGWNGGRGPYDCEQLEVKPADAVESFGAFASYSVGPGWALR